MRKAINTILALLFLAALAFSSTEGFGTMSGPAAFWIAFPVAVAAGIGLVKFNTEWIEYYDEQI